MCLFADGVGFLHDSSVHEVELLPGIVLLNATDALPHLVGFEGLALVHQVSGAFGQEEHAGKHDGREDEGGAEDVAPVARHAEEDGSHSVAEDFSEGNVELV